MRIIILFVLGCFMSVVFAAHLPNQNTSKNNAYTRLNQMFTQMVEKKDLSKIPVFYAKDFVMISNGVKIPYKQYYQDHVKPYHSQDTFSVSYDKQAVFWYKNKVAARVFITIKEPNQSAKRLELVLIAILNKHNKFEKMWVLNHPNSYHVMPIHRPISKVQS